MPENSQDAYNLPFLIFEGSFDPAHHEGLPFPDERFFRIFRLPRGHNPFVIHSVFFGHLPRVKIFVGLCDNLPGFSFQFGSVALTTKNIN